MKNRPSAYNADRLREKNMWIIIKMCITHIKIPLFKAMLLTCVFECVHVLCVCIRRWVCGHTHGPYTATSCPAVWCCQMYEWQIEKWSLIKLSALVHCFSQPSCLGHFASHFFHLSYSGTFRYSLFKWPFYMCQDPSKVKKVSITVSLLSPRLL